MKVSLYIDDFDSISATFVGKGIEYRQWEPK